jgi:hypothetical protein
MKNKTNPGKKPEKKNSISKIEPRSVVDINFKKARIIIENQ